MQDAQRSPDAVKEDETKTLLYPIVAEWDGAVQACSLLSPDFPEVASAATSREELWQQADDAIRTAIEARRKDGEAVPPPHGRALAADRGLAARQPQPAAARRDPGLPACALAGASERQLG